MPQTEPLGTLVPLGGGDPIPLLKEHLTVGRRPSADICLKFQNVSGTHCELIFERGRWIIRDLNSSNGIKVKGKQVPKRTLQPGDEISIASHRFTIHYTMSGGAGTPDAQAEEEDLFAESLLKKAGLEKQDAPASRPRNRG